jgi:glycosyltransferase involved in cell wall biosynthesis
LGLEKSVDELLRRFKLIHSQVSNAKLIIIGDGPERDHLQALVKNFGLSDAVVFRGYVPSESIAAYYQHADLFVFASTSEVHPMVGLEAAACGLPIVARARMGITKCVVDGQTGFLVDPDDSQVFADRAVELIRNTALRHEFSDAARIWAQREIGLPRMANQAVEVYHRAMQAFSGWNGFTVPGNVASELELEHRIP